MEHEMEAYERALVEEALSRYALSDPKVEFLRHNENITCRVYDGDMSCVLRVKKPREGFSFSIFGEISPSALMESETALLRRLSERADFSVQAPIKALDGEDFCLLSDGSPACLLSWIDGQTLDKASCANETFELGRMAARLHEAVKDFDGVRLSYSHELVSNVRAEISRAASEAHITDLHRERCHEALDEIDRVMYILDSADGAKSLIHADLNIGNIIVTESGLSPIDFSMSGYGYRAAECGMLASNYTDASKHAEILAGYESASGIKIEPHHCDCFLAFGVLLFIAAQHGRYYKEEWFAKSMDRWCGGCLVLKGV